jgi:hypothetical protein
MARARFREFRYQRMAVTAADQAGIGRPLSAASMTRLLSRPPPPEAARPRQRWMAFIRYPVAMDFQATSDEWRVQAADLVDVGEHGAWAQAR